MLRFICAAWLKLPQKINTEIKCPDGEVMIYECGKKLKRTKTTCGSFNQAAQIKRSIV